ncbi:MAG: hypothetical protein KR126chlam4_01253 [Candidatus Anoxychlamydiales bacterium]|nr:hypothetical protein [Candidatus Anoxychlamydiales bacterium]HEU63997.1 hypothetical protein [Chlamydiota bacterium]
MDVEKVGGTKGPKPADKKERTSTPDSEEFREMMRTGKVSETEFEKPKKRPKQQGQPKLGGRELPQAPMPKGPELPSPYDGYAQSQPPVRESIEEPEQPLEQDKKTKKQKKKEKEELALYQKGKLKEAPKTTKEEAKAKAPQVKAPSGKETPQAPSEKAIKPTGQAKKSKEEKEKEPEKPQIQQSTVLQEMPPNIASGVQSMTAPLTPYLHPDIVPLFEKMVGTIVQLQAKGITTTEVMLNSPAFQSSMFYGSSIVVQKYSTAPAFNIFLRGPTQAVNMFSENLDGLYDAFKKANINIGRLEAQHEKFTFRRKEKPSSDKDTGGKK